VLQRQCAANIILLSRQARARARAGILALAALPGNHRAPDDDFTHSNYRRAIHRCKRNSSPRVRLWRRISLTVPNAHSLVVVLGLGFICQLAGYFLSDLRVGPCTRNLVLPAVAPLTAVLALFLFDEVMTVLQLLGGGLILTAVWIITNQSQASCREA
jgi:hypothetical protein